MTVVKSGVTSLEVLEAISEKAISKMKVEEPKKNLLFKIQRKLEERNSKVTLLGSPSERGYSVYRSLHLNPCNNQMRSSRDDLYSPVDHQIRQTTNEPFHGVFESYKSQNIILPTLKEDEDFFV